MLTEKQISSGIKQIERIYKLKEDLDTICRIITCEEPGESPVYGLLDNILEIFGEDLENSYPELNDVYKIMELICMSEVVLPEKVSLYLDIRNGNINYSSSTNSFGRKVFG